MLMYLANLHGEGLSIFPTHRVVMGARELTPDLLHAFAVRELTATPAELERELGAIPPETIAFGVWRGSDRPALLCTLADRSAVMMAMSGSPPRPSQDRRGRAGVRDPGADAGPARRS